MRLKGKIAVITGSGSGIGRATTILFAREGALVVCVDVDEKGGRETVETVKGALSESVDGAKNSRQVLKMWWRAVKTAFLSFSEEYNGS